MVTEKEVFPIPSKKKKTTSKTLRKTKTTKPKLPKLKHFRTPRKTKSRTIAASPISSIIENYSTNKEKFGSDFALYNLRKTAQTLISGVNAAIRALERKNNAVFSAAAMKYRDTGTDDFIYELSPDGKNIIISNAKPLLTAKEIKEMGYNCLIMEIAKAQDFLNSATSTRIGVEKLNYEQDQRIFGTYANGAPKYEMTPDQRSKFWSLYNEFMDSNPAIKESGYSTIIQQLVGASTDSTYSITPNTFNNILNNFHKHLSEIIGDEAASVATKNMADNDEGGNIVVRIKNRDN